MVTLKRPLFILNRPLSVVVQITDYYRQLTDVAETKLTILELGT